MCLQPAEVTRKMLRDKHNKKNPTQPNPVFPNWVYDRPALLGDFITSPSPAADPAVAIGTQEVHFHTCLCCVWPQFINSRADVVCAQARCPWRPRNKLWWRTCCSSWLVLMVVTSPPSLCWGGRTALL